MPFLLGLTGNIACGQSTVGGLLVERYGADYLDADAVVHEFYAAGTPETAAIASRFGAHLLRPNDATIDRRALGEIVMRDAAARQDLENILYPAVRRRIEQRIAASTAAVMVLDAIKLIEAGLADRCNTIWVVTCDRETQIERLRSTRGLTEAEAVVRVDAQGPQAEKVKRAAAVLENRGSRDDLARQVDAAWRRTVAQHVGTTTTRF
jgi:dephospho-CoA kinase